MAQPSKQTYYSNTTVTCANCSSEYILGMTLENPQLEICGNCHPFYTGKEVLVDTAGRIEKFQARAAKAAKATSAKKKVKARKSKQSLADLAA